MNEGFSDDEVYEFKVVFETQASMAGTSDNNSFQTLNLGTGSTKNTSNQTLPKSIVLQMVDEISTLNKEQHETVNRVMDKPPAQSERQPDEVTFRGFLRVMRLVLDQNFGHIKDRHAKVERNHSKDRESSKEDGEN